MNTVVKGTYYTTVLHEDGLPTADDLAIDGELLVSRPNHREYLYNGKKYSMGWRSRKNPTDNIPSGWVVFETE